MSKKSKKSSNAAARKGNISGQQEGQGNSKGRSAEEMNAMRRAKKASQKKQAHANRGKSTATEFMLFNAIDRDRAMGIRRRHADSQRDLNNAQALNRVVDASFSTV